MREITAAFTGHRPHNLGLGEDECVDSIICIKKRLAVAVEDAVSEGYTHFISGMGLGVDIWSAETVLAQREKTAGITLECAVPCVGQTDRWNEVLRKRYNDILMLADKVTVLSDKYYTGCMFKRNCYMVDKSSLLIAVYKGNSGGGTAHTVHYALRQGIRIENVI